MNDRRARRRPVIWGFAAGGLMFVIGAPLPHALLVGLAIVALAPALHAASIELHDRPTVPRHLRREGSRRELSKLMSYRSRRSRGADDEAVRRLRAAALRRLGDLGVDGEVDGEDAHRALGPLAYGVLLERTARPPIPDRRFSHCLDAVEALARRRQERSVGTTSERRPIPRAFG